MEKICDWIFKNFHFISVSLLRNKKLRGYYWCTTVFIISLGVSDFLFSIVNLPFLARHYAKISRKENLEQTETFCQFFTFFIYGHMTVSLGRILYSLQTF